MLPVLSRCWARLLQAPGPAWAEVDINTDALFSDGAEPDSVAMVAWFSRRAGSVVTLRVGGGQRFPPLLGGEVQRLPPSLVGLVLMSQAASLRELHLSCGACSLDNHAIAALAALSGLTKLVIQLPHAGAAREMPWLPSHLFP